MSGPKGENQAKSIFNKEDLNNSLPKIHTLNYHQVHPEFRNWSTEASSSSVIMPDMWLALRCSWSILMALNSFTLEITLGIIKSNIILVRKIDTFNRQKFPIAMSMYWLSNPPMVSNCMKIVKREKFLLKLETIYIGSLWYCQARR